MSSQQVKSSKRTTSCDNRDQFDVISVLLYGGRDVHRRSWMRAGSVPRRRWSWTSTETPGADLELAVAVAAGRDHGAVGQTPHRVSLPGCYGTTNWHGDLLRDRFPGILPVSEKNKEPGRAPAALRWLRRGGWAAQERPCRVRSHTGRRPIDLTSSASAFSSSTETLTRLLAKALSGRPWTISHSPL